MPTNHAQRHCFREIDFSGSPLVVVTDFTTGEIYEFDFTDYATALAAFVATPTGRQFNSGVRNLGIPFVRISPPYKSP
jgi:hypothetical protein